MRRSRKYLCLLPALLVPVLTACEAILDFDRTPLQPVFEASVPSDGARASSDGSSGKSSSSSSASSSGSSGTPQDSGSDTGSSSGEPQDSGSDAEAGS